MGRDSWLALLGVALATTTACEGADNSSGGGAEEPEQGGASPSGQTADTSSSAGPTGSSSSSSSSSSSGQGGGGGQAPLGLDAVGTLVVLGDSISDGGGQGPFYYALLRDMLEAKYGPVSFHREAQSGSKTGALLGQIDELPQVLPGPVVVTITSGGNDMKAALPLIVAGADQAARATMGNNVDAALAELATEGRFGPGTAVYVFEANIYDASAGAGDFGAHDCAFGQGLPAIPTDSFFDAWNGEIEARVASRGQTLLDMHASFYDHGYAGNPSWFAGDCTHPNSLGHAALADLFYTAITGETP